MRLQLPISFPGLGHVNCYMMEDKKGVTLIDPGLPGVKTWRRLKQMLGSVGVDPKHVRTVIVTHSHPDHFGQIPRLRRVAGAEIVTHRSFRTFLDPEAEGDEMVLETVPADQTNGQDDRPKPLVSAETPFGAKTPWSGKPFEMPRVRRLRYRATRFATGKILSAPRPTKRVDDADVIELGDRNWVAVHTPGHTEDHLCLWDPDNGVMVSGDHVLPTITPHISGLTASTDPLAQFFDSLDRMKSYSAVTAVLPAHGLVFDDLGGRADAITRHHHGRLNKLKIAGELVGNGTVEQYMRQLFKERSWGSMAESETYAHLEHLRRLNQAEVSQDGPQLRYKIRD